MSLLNFNVVAEHIEDIETERLESAFEQLNVSVESLSEIESACEGIEVSEEGLINFMNKIGDSVLQVGNTFKSLLLNGGERSELKFWYESNTLSVKTLEGKASEDFSKVRVDIPTGMKGTYANAVSAITDNYSVVDVNAEIKKGAKAMDVVLSSMSKGSDSHENLVASSSKVLESKLKNWNARIKVLDKQFATKGKSLEKKDFKDVFASVDEVKNTRLSLIGLEDKLLDVKTIRKNMETMNHSLGLAVDFIKRSNEGGIDSDYVPSKAFVKNLATYVRMVALTLENYSDVVVKQLAVEHNLVLTYSALLSASV
jgi:hypothetical protein